jgi:protein-tyrosine-phosphatase
MSATPIRPQRVLFACTFNAIRSPLAAGLLRAQGGGYCVESVGVDPRPIDPFVVAVMAEIGIDLTDHHPRSFAELDGQGFDRIITLSSDARLAAGALRAMREGGAEHWPAIDAPLGEGSRAMRLDAYRGLRDSLHRLVAQRFPRAGRGLPP